MDKSKIHKMWNADQGDGTYTNPILYTDYSDPDAIRVGEDYFLIASSFCNTPAVPLLHSKDLVNWKVINYCVEKLPFDRYDKPAHGCGVWAPAIRYHEGVYYVFIPMPDEGIMMCSATDPWGKWSGLTCVKKAVGWIDPCPFWDEDGKAYMVSAFARSRIGFKSLLYMSPIEPDCSGVLDDGKFIYDGNATQPTIEGPKLYKRNGYYYIFAPAGGVKTGWQTVLRSRNIYGPYEEKIVLHQGNTPVNGPHQGAWLDTPGGQDWFLHFQDVGNAGRTLHLQPMHWVDDWPVIGVNADESGCGEPVLRYPKPGTGKDAPKEAPKGSHREIPGDFSREFPCEYPREFPREFSRESLREYPLDSDFFEGERLGLQWQWNANFREEWYRVGDGRLVLNAQPVEQGIQLCDVSNLLLQKWPAPEFQITARLHLDRLRDGDSAGLVSLGGCYTSLLIHRENGVLSLQQRTGNWTKDDEVRASLGTVEKETVYLRMVVAKETYVSFAIGYEEDAFWTVGRTVEATPGRWVGVKAGLAAIREEAGCGGSVTADFFVFEPLEGK